VSGRPPSVDRRRLIERAEQRLIDRLRAQLALVRRERAVRAAAASAIADDARELVDRELAVLPAARREELLGALLRRTVGFGPLESLMEDPRVSEILVTAPERIYAEREGRLELTDIKLEGDGELRELIERLLAPGGRRVDELSPMADSVLPDGSRVNVVIPPLALDGPQVSVRRFGAIRPGLDELRAGGAFDDRATAILSAAALNGESVLISGGTSSGKTTLLAAVAARIPQGLRIVTVEDSAEIPLDRDHVVRLQGRPPGVGGVGEVTIRDLVRNALRMRPDRLIVGEVRGPEALDLLTALNTGHRGVLSTIHANSARDALDRLRDLALLSGIGLPASAIEAQAARAVDLVAHLERRAGTRRLVEIGRPRRGGGVDAAWGAGP
jgi:pilus assembly protein CpaF